MSNHSFYSPYKDQGRLHSRVDDFPRYRLLATNETQQVYNYSITISL